MLLTRTCTATWVLFTTASPALGTRETYSKFSINEAQRGLASSLRLHSPSRLGSHIGQFLFQCSFPNLAAPFLPLLFLSLSPFPAVPSHYASNGNLTQADRSQAAGPHAGRIGEDNMLRGGGIGTRGAARLGGALMGRG